MNKLIQAALCSMLSCVAWVSAQAADDGRDNYVDILATAGALDSDKNVDNGMAGISGRFGKAFNERWNLELALGANKLDPDTSKSFRGLKQFILGGNALAVFNRGGSFQPYLMAGLGVVRAEYAKLSSDTNNYYDLGAGALVPLFSNRARLRAEIVQRAENDAIDSKDWFLHIGIGFPFGKKASPAPVVVAAAAPVDSDSDGDGVADSADRCPGTPAGAAVDANGCELDSDGDGVVDSADQCPGTPAGTEVDANGCAVVIVVNLYGVNFRSNSADLLSNVESQLNAQAATLLDNPDVQIEVAGHTDAVGEASDNLDLSQRRAEAVRDYLIAKGVIAERIIAKGYGESEPIASNDDVEGKAENRRVELRIRD